MFSMSIQFYFGQHLIFPLLVPEKSPFPSWALYLTLSLTLIHTPCFAGCVVSHFTCKSFPD
jgi:hypothetical protein